MTSDAEGVLAQLRSKGHRLTKTRKEFLDFLLSRKGHWTIQQLQHDVARNMPSIGVATIYRTVNLLAELGYLTETKLAGSASRFEVAGEDHHDHLTCITCGEIFEFENEEIEELQRSVAQKLGFQLSDHRMELYGECRKPHCKYKKQKSNKS